MYMFPGINKLGKVNPGQLLLEPVVEVNSVVNSELVFYIILVGTLEGKPYLLLSVRLGKIAEALHVFGWFVVVVVLGSDKHHLKWR